MTETTLATHAFPSVAGSRALLLDVIGPAPELTLIHGPGNRGDELIAAGTRALLDHHVYREVGADALAGVAGDTALILGSGAWWVGLTFLVSRLRTRLTVDVLRWVNRLSGAVLLVFGLAAIAVAIGLI